MLPLSTGRRRTARTSTTLSRAARSTPGAAIVPAALALAEHRGLQGSAVIKGIVVGMEFACRGMVAAGDPSRRVPSFRRAVRARRGGGRRGDARACVAIAHALGIAGSFASGIIEYLADGAWTKRYPGWAAQAGIRAALSPRRASPGRSRCSKARTASTRRSRRRSRRTSRCSSASSARATSSTASRSSPTPAAR